MNIQSHSTIDIRKYLKSFAGEKLYYYPNPGNGGDSLIALATYRLFEDLNLNIEILNYQDSQNIDSSNKILLYAGGGNLVNNYHGDSRIFLERHHSIAKKVIILPHTINTHEDLLSLLGSNVEIICRELISFEYVQKIAPKTRVMLADDLAFSLDVRDVLAQTPMSLAESIGKKVITRIGKDSLANFKIPTPKRIIGNNILEVKKAWERLNSSKPTNLNCFRTDGEKTDVALPSDNVDIAQSFQYGTASQEIAFYAVYRLLSLIDKYDEVTTNRLHMAVAGTLLGKTVNFAANNYYKCKAVYEFSIKDKFPNVNWIG